MGAIWPPDWSQSIPDALGAIITGVIVGVVVIGIETARDRRLESRIGRAAAADLLRTAGSTLADPLGWMYTERSLTPSSKAVAAVRERVAALPPQSGRDGAEPALVFLLTIAQLDEQLELAAEQVETRLRHHSLGDLDHAAMLRYARSFVDRPEQPWDVTGTPLSTAPRSAALQADADLSAAVASYGRVAQRLELARQAFNAADGDWRASTWRIQLAQTKGAPRFPPTRWWRARRAAAERADASKSATAKGAAIMARGGTWIPPRAP